MWFRVYYADGTTFDGSGDDDAMAAPTMGALVVKHEAPCNATGHAIRSATFFCWETYPHGKGRWGGKDDLFGLCRYYQRQEGPQKVLIGEEVADEIYRRARAQAADDEYKGP